MQNAEAVTTRYLVKDSVGQGAKSNMNAFSPKLGLVYKPSKSTSVFASYSNSFAVNSGTDVYKNALPASLIDQYEIGVKNEMFNGKLSANLTLYRIVNNNLAQMAEFGANGTTPNTNTAIKEMVGQTTSDGLEVDMNSRPTAGLTILAGYSYNNMRYTKTKSGRGYYVEGERLVNTPAHTANTSLFYTLQKGALKGLRFGAGGFYVGERFGGWNNTQPKAGEPPLKTRLIPVKGFTTVDLSAGYTFKKLSLIAKVSNLFNVYNYYVHENYSVNPIAPRQFISTVSVKL
jgi:iron complex outermembrane receptor protein